MALSPLAHCRCLVSSRNSHRRHHESNSPPGSYAHSFCQSPTYHDHISERTLAGRSEEAAGQTFFDRSPPRQPHGGRDLSLANQRRKVLRETSNCGPEQPLVNQMILSSPILTAVPEVDVLPP